MEWKIDQGEEVNDGEFAALEGDFKIKLETLLNLLRKYSTLNKPCNVDRLFELIKLEEQPEYIRLLKLKLYDLKHELNNMKN